jgi:Fic family protein
MVSVKKKVVHGRSYYYLEHSYRKEGKVYKLTKYLGTTLPPSLDEEKGLFLTSHYQEVWYPLFEGIKKKYAADKAKQPREIAKKELDRFTTMFTYTTNRIEGSTLTLRETEELLEQGLSPQHRPLADVKETEAHKEVFNSMLTYDHELRFSTVLHWHKMLFSQTKASDAGLVRTYQVGISGSKYQPPLPIELDFLLQQFFRWYHQNKRTIHPVHLAALVHLRFVSVHPFGDGNGRVSRLLMNYVLHKYGYPMLIIEYKQRGSYYTALERSQLTKDEGIFIQWFFKRYCKEYRRFLPSEKNK